MAFNNKAPDVKSSSKFLGIQVLLAPHQGQGGGLNISRTGQSNYKSILKAKPSKHSTISFCVGSSNCAARKGESRNAKIFDKIPPLVAVMAKNVILSEKIKFYI